MSRLPDLRGMAVLAKVVELGSFIAAGRQLKISSSTVSQTVARLELRLGKRLIIRHTRRMVVTEAGQDYASRALSILRQAEALELEFVLRFHPKGLKRHSLKMSDPRNVALVSDVSEAASGPDVQARKASCR